MIGPLEITVMEILWAKGESNVHDVVQRLERPLAYTTVMTTLDRLYKKGILDRRKEDRAFFYAPRFTKAEWERKQASNLLAAFFAGPKSSGDLLISCLVDVVGQQDAALLDELEQRIRDKRRELDRRGRKP
jgi:predicted transcriptional regulator